VFVCTHNSAGPIQTVIIRADTSSSATTFTAEKAQSTANGQAVSIVPGVGDDACPLTISSGCFTTNTFAVRKGTTEVQVNGPGTMTQSQTQAYASHS